MKPAPPVTRTRIARSLDQALQAGPQPLSPMREVRSTLAFAPQDGVRRAKGRPAELLRRDLAHAGLEPSLLEDRRRELRPGALSLGGEVPGAIGEVEQLARGLGQMADEGRRADLIRDDRDLVLLSPQREHRPQEVPPGRTEEPGAAHDPAVAHLELARELRAPVRRERIRLVRLDVGLPLRAVEDVVGRVVDDRSPQLDHVARAADVHGGRERFPLLAPSTSVQAAAWRTRPGGGSSGGGATTLYSALVRASALGKTSRSAAPSWPPAPVMSTPRGRAPRGSASACSKGGRRADRSSRPRARPGPPGRTPR